MVMPSGASHTVTRASKYGCEPNRATNPTTTSTLGSEPGLTSTPSWREPLAIRAAGVFVDKPASTANRSVVRRAIHVDGIPPLRGQLEAVFKQERPKTLSACASGAVDRQSALAGLNSHGATRLGLAADTTYRLPYGGLRPKDKHEYEAGPAITFYLGKWGSSGQFCSDRPKTSDLDVSDQLLSEAIEPQD